MTAVLPGEAERRLHASYAEYLAVVGEATFVDVARRTDPARSQQPWRSLSAIVAEHGPPAVVQVWTKGPRAVLELGGPLLASLRAQGTTLVCQLTVTGFGPAVEPLVPWPVDWDGIDEWIGFLGTPEAILWRYDPVMPGLSTLESLETLAAGFAARGVTKAVYNWGECGWGLVRDRLGTAAVRIDVSVDRGALSRGIEAIGRSHGITFSILAEGDRLDGGLSLSSRGCWQYEWLARVGDRFPPRAFLPGTIRAGCICAHSFDVGLEGQFDGCHRCAYCFAP